MAKMPSCECLMFGTSVTFCLVLVGVKKPGFELCGSSEVRVMVLFVHNVK